MLSLTTILVKPRWRRTRSEVRRAQVEFAQSANATVEVRVTFDSEPTHPVEQQRGGWQAILDNFARYVERKTAV